MKIFFHSSDLDGMCSGAIVKFKYPGAELVGINYGQPFPFDTLVKDEIVFMVDFSLSPFLEMLKLSSIIGGEKLIWIDHHKSAIEDANKVELMCNQMKISFNQMCPGKREIGKGACELVWEYLFPNIRPPIAIELLSKYDVWDLKDSSVLPFQYGMRLNDTDPNNQELWKLFIDNDNTPIKIINKTIADGELILKYQKQQNEKYCKSCAFELDFKGYKAIVVNKLLTSSQLFESVWNKEKYNIMITFGLRSNGTWTMSFYTDKEGVDVSVLAKSLGGGGHAQAAGCVLKKLPDDFIERIKKLQPVEFKDIPDHGDKMTINDFIECATEGSIIDYDGYGKYTTEDKMTDIKVYPSDVFKDKIDNRWSHVIWFNK